MTTARRQSKSSSGLPSRRRASQSSSSAEATHVDYLNLTGLRTTAPPDQEEFSLWIKAEQFPKLQSCPRCACDDLRFKRNGTRPRIVRDVPRGLQSVYIELERQNYYCDTCRNFSQHPLPALSATGRHMTARLVSYIGKQSLIRPASEVALLTGASTKTVREIMIEHRNYLDKTVIFETPQVLGLDGVFASVKNEEGKRKKIECAHFTDIEGGVTIDLRPGITIAAVREVLRKLANPERVRVVVIDMASPLLAAVLKELPHAIIVIDLFHIQNKINLGLDKVRKRLRKGATRKKGQLTMCSKELLRKRREQLTPFELKELDRWFDLKPELQLAYDVKESCLKIWHSSSSRTARERYRRWRAQFPPALLDDFAELLSAFDRWGKYIFNYFDHRFTNAFTESRNRLVKDIQRETRGCDFVTLRGKVVHGPRIKKQIEEARREEMRRKKRKPQVEGSSKSRRRRKRTIGTEAEPAPLDLIVGDFMLPALQMDLFQ